MGRNEHYMLRHLKFRQTLKAFWCQPSYACRIWLQIITSTPRVYNIFRGVIFVAIRKPNVVVRPRKYFSEGVGIRQHLATTVCCHSCIRSLKMNAMNVSAQLQRNEGGINWFSTRDEVKFRVREFFTCRNYEFHKRQLSILIDSLASSHCTHEFMREYAWPVEWTSIFSAYVWKSHVMATISCSLFFRVDFEWTHRAVHRRSQLTKIVCWNEAAAMIGKFM